MNPIQIFFSRLFPKVMLQNKLVATIVQQIGIRLAAAKTELDNATNTDI
jgi:hypothetical protein